MLSPEEIKANIEKMKAKYGDSRVGGKGTQRLKQKNLAKPVADDKAIKGLYKKLGVQAIQSVD